jgi:hypothetical protein
MIAWVTHRIGWFIVRAAGTLACIITIHNLINRHGLRIDFSNLLLVSICAIVAIRMWMPSCSQDKNQ